MWLNTYSFFISSNAHIKVMQLQNFKEQGKDEKKSLKQPNKSWPNQTMIKEQAVEL